MADSQQHPGGVIVTALGIDAPMHVWDAMNGALLFSFKSNACVPRTLVSLAYPTVEGAKPTGFFLAASQATRPALRTWSWGKEASLYTSGTSERMVSLAASPDGALVLGGSVSGKAHLWAAASGRLLASWQAHYKPTSAVAFARGGRVLVTGGEDANVHVWNPVDILSTKAGSAAPTPTVSLSGHTLAVTCIREIPPPSSGAPPLLVTGASDRTVRVWNSATGAQLAVRTAESGVTDIAVDAAGTRLFVGTGSGDILDVPLLQLAAADAPVVQAAAPVGGVAPVSGTWVPAPLPAEEGTDGAAQASSGQGSTLQGHTAAVHSLAVHGAGHMLYSAGADGSVRFWDVGTGQCVRSVAPTKVSAITAVTTSGGTAGAAVPVTAVLWMSQPPGLPHGVPSRNAPPIAPLSKFATPPTGTEVTGVVATAGQCVPAHLPAPAGAFDSLGELLVRGASAWEDALVALPEGAAGAAPAPAQGGTEALEAEVARLKEEVSRWQTVNNQLVQRLAAAEGGAEKEAQSPPKRSRRARK